MKPTKLLVFLSLTIVTLGFQGCDQFETLTNYFKSDQKEKPKTVTAPAQPAQSAPEGAMTGAVRSAPAGELGSNELARIGNWTLTKEEFNAYLEAVKNELELRKEVNPEIDVTITPERKQILLNDMLQRVMLAQEAERSGLAQEPEVRRALEAFRRNLLAETMTARLIENVEVTDEDAQQYYEENKADLVEVPSARIKEIVVETEDLAKQILGQIYQGANFGELAMQHSKSATASEGGDVGWLPADQFPFQKMAQVVSTLDEGNVSTVFKGPDGFYIVKLLELKEGETAEYEAIKEDIKAGLTIMQRQQELLNKLDEISAQTNVQINEQLIQEL